MGEEYVAMEDVDMGDVFLLEKSIWLCKMSSCWRRVYGYGRCLLAGEEYMAMEDVFLLETNILLWQMSSSWRRIYGY